MDAPLMYEVLLYLNVYYFGVFAGSEMLIVFAKFNGPLPTPHIELDGAVVAGILISELIKLLTFNRLRDLDRKCKCLVCDFHVSADNTSFQCHKPTTNVCSFVDCR